MLQIPQYAGEEKRSREFSAGEENAVQWTLAFIDDATRKLICL